jgi:AcrR family transcriptional regulator
VSNGIPVSSRARRQAETRAALLDAADRLFCRDGYAVTTLERIAAEGGFTKGAIYANFTSKEALFLALQERRSRTVIEDWADELSAAAGSEAHVQAISRYVGRLFLRQREWALVAAEFWAIAARRPELAAVLRDVYAGDRAEIGRLIRGALPSDTGLGERGVGERGVGELGVGELGVGELGVGERGVGELARQTIALLDGLAIQARVDPDVDFVGVFSRAFAALVSAASVAGRRSA